MLRRNFCLSYPLRVSPSVATIYLVSPRIAIVLSLSSAANFSMPRLSIFLVTSNTSPSSLYTSHSHHYVSHSLLLCHRGTSARLLPLDYWFTSFFFLAGPDPLHEIVVSAFSRRPLGRANTFSFLCLLVTPVNLLRVPPPSPCFLALAFPLVL